jgi:hypothetical protein
VSVSRADASCDLLSTERRDGSRDGVPSLAFSGVLFRFSLNPFGGPLSRDSVYDMRRYTTDAHLLMPVSTYTHSVLHTTYQPRRSIDGSSRRTRILCSSRIFLGLQRNHRVQPPNSAIRDPDVLPSHRIFLFCSTNDSSASTQSLSRDRSTHLANLTSQRNPFPLRNRFCGFTVREYRVHDLAFLDSFARVER